ncbi:hypothetical protein GW17_00056973 [Ensete ventricosum]|nr:hypothetical protein GW17_00056973 [Ensete ventricosum]RZS24766.1 hypothetical protein BHM03_00057902 [Ensete ventricosum]
MTAVDSQRSVTIPTPCCRSTLNLQSSAPSISSCFFPSPPWLPASTGGEIKGIPDLISFLATTLNRSLLPLVSTVTTAQRALAPKHLDLPKFSVYTSTAAALLEEFNLSW